MGGSHAQGLGQILHGLIDMLGHLVGGLFISRREGATLMPTTAPATSPVVMPHQNCPLLISIPPFFQNAPWTGVSVIRYSSPKAGKIRC